MVMQVYSPTCFKEALDSKSILNGCSMGKFTCCHCKVYFSRSCSLQEIPFQQEFAVTESTWSNSFLNCRTPSLCPWYWTAVGSSGEAGCISDGFVLLNVLSKYCPSPALVALQRSHVPKSLKEERCLAVALSVISRWLEFICDGLA